MKSKVKRNKHKP